MTVCSGSRDGSKVNKREAAASEQVPHHADDLDAFATELTRNLCQEVASPTTSNFLARQLPEATYFGVQLHVGRVFLSVQDFTQTGRCRLTLLHGRNAVASACLATGAALSCNVECTRTSARWYDVRKLAEHRPDARVMLVVPVPEGLPVAGCRTAVAGAHLGPSPARSGATVTIGLRTADSAVSERALRLAEMIAVSLAPRLPNYSQLVLESFASAFVARPLGVTAPASASSLQGAVPTAAAVTVAPQPAAKAQQTAPAHDVRRSVPAVLDNADTGPAARTVSAGSEQQHQDDEHCKGYASASGETGCSAADKPQRRLAPVRLHRHPLWLYFSDRTYEHNYVVWYSKALHKVQAALDILLLLLLVATCESPWRAATLSAHPLALTCIASSLMAALTLPMRGWYSRNREGVMQAILLANTVFFWNVTQPFVLSALEALASGNQEWSAPVLPWGPSVKGSGWARTCAPRAVAPLAGLALLLGPSTQVLLVLVAKVRLTRYVPVLLLHLCAALFRGVPGACASSCCSNMSYCKLAATSIVVVCTGAAAGVAYAVEFAARSMFEQHMAADPDLQLEPDAGAPAAAGGDNAAAHTHQAGGSSSGASSHLQTSAAASSPQVCQAASVLSAA